MRNLNLKNLITTIILFSMVVALQEALIFLNEN
jgi:hypothetical protein